MDSEKPLVSVIVPTRNSESTITDCLRTIRNQNYKRIEILIVDNNSVDRTVEISSKYGRVVTKGPERSSQRNFGAINARGKYLFFVDSDMELTPTVIEECVNEAEQKEASAVIVPEISVGEGFWAKCKALERSCYLGDEMIEGARFIDKEVFDALEGYDEEITGTEDWDLSIRVKKGKYRICRIKSLIIHNEGRLRLSDCVRKKYYYAETLRRYIAKHPDSASKQLIPIRQAFIKNWRKLLADPTHAVGFALMKFCEFGIAGLALVVQTIM